MSAGVSTTLSFCNSPFDKFKRKLSDPENNQRKKQRLNEVAEKLKWEKENNRKIVQAFEHNFNQKIFVVYQWLKSLNLLANVEISIFPQTVKIIMDEDKCVEFLKDYLQSSSKNLKSWRKNNYLKGRVRVWYYLLESVDLWAKQVAFFMTSWIQNHVRKIARAKLWLEIQNCPMNYSTRHVKTRPLTDRRLIKMNDVVATIWELKKENTLVETLQGAISKEVAILQRINCILFQSQKEKVKNLNLNRLSNRQSSENATSLNISELIPSIPRYIPQYKPQISNMEKAAQDSFQKVQLRMNPLGVLHTNYDSLSSVMPFQCDEMYGNQYLVNSSGNNDLNQLLMPPNVEIYGPAVHTEPTFPLYYSSPAFINVPPEIPSDCVCVNGNESLPNLITPYSLSQYSDLPIQHVYNICDQMFENDMETKSDTRPSNAIKPGSENTFLPLDNYS